MSHALGPIEVLVIEFPGSQFNGRIIPEVQTLIDREIINVVDGLLVTKDADGDVSIVEFEQEHMEDSNAHFIELLGDVVVDLVSAEDVAEFAKAIDPGSSAAVLVFEHRWAKPFQRAVLNSGGVVVTDLRIPGPVVSEVLEALEAETVPSI
jgi:hypothetical protein